MNKLHRIHATVVSDEKSRKETERRKRVPTLPRRVDFNLACSGECPSCGGMVIEGHHCRCGQLIKWEMMCVRKNIRPDYSIETYRYKSIEEE